MADYIDKEKLRHAMYHEAFETDTDLQKWDSGCWIRYRLFENIVDALPAADVKQVVHGKWTIEQMNTYELSYGTTAYEPVYRCSACKMLTESYLRLDEPIMPEDADFPKFCPNCGADMRESEE